VTSGVRSVDRGRLAWLGAGGAAVLAGTLLGWNAELLDAVAHPPTLLRAGLVAAGVLAGLALLRAAIRRLGTGSPISGAELTGAEVAGLIRAIRLVFLSVAAFAAALGWLLGHPLPFIVALVIAGVDLLETSLLLLVVTIRREA
jgi:hypothetical protein